MKNFRGLDFYREPAIAETFTKAGFDFIAIDMEHTTISIDDANRIITLFSPKAVSASRGRFRTAMTT